jgi:hypothetical protein
MSNKTISALLAIASLAATAAHATCQSDLMAIADQYATAAEAADARVSAAQDAYQACTSAATPTNCDAEANELASAIQDDSAAWDAFNTVDQASC